MMRGNRGIEDIAANAFLADTPFIHSTCHAFVSSHVRLGDEDGLGPGNYDLSKDLLEVETEETFMGQVATLTVLPRRPYHLWIFPNDWISIYMSSGANLSPEFGVVGDPERADEDIRVFFGFIDAIRVSTAVDTDTGRTQVRYSISCSGIQKAFDKTMIYFNPLLNTKTRFGAMLPGLATLAYGVPLAGTPTTIPRGIALAYLGYGGQFLMPESYQKRISSPAEQKAYVKQAFSKAITIEETMGILNGRGVSNRPQMESVIQRVVQKHRDQFEASSVVTVIDMFSYVEDFFVDGRVINTPFKVTQSNLWQTMYENCNPILNECFLTLRPDVAGVFKGQKDEWGMQPKYVPSLVIRERPFSWINSDILESTSLAGKNIVLRSPTKGGKFKDFPIGDVFFSSIYNKVKLPPQQNVRDPATVLLMKKRVAAEQKIREFNGESSSQGDAIAEFKKKFGFEPRVVDGKVITEDLPLLQSYLSKARQIEREAIAKDTANPNLEIVGGLSRDSRWVEVVQLRSSDIFSETLGLSDNDQVNFFMVSQASIPIATSLQKFVLLLDGIIPMYHSESIRRHGLRLREMTTKFMSTGAAQIDNKEAFDFLIRTLLLQDQWYQHQPYYRAGTISSKPVPKAHVGMVLEVTGPGRDEVFYIEGVSQKWSRSPETGSGRLYSSFTVTRGQPSEKRFKYTPPDAVQMLVNGIEVPRKDASKQPEVERSMYPLEADQYKLLKRLIQSDLSAEIQIILIAEEAALARADFQAKDGGQVTPFNLERLEAALAKTRNADTTSPDMKAQIDKMMGKYKKTIAPIKTTPLFKVKEDRLKVGLPPWAVQVELRDKMWDPIRRPDRSIDVGLHAEAALDLNINKG